MDERVVRCDGEPVSIAPKAVDVLLVLLSRQGNVVDKRDLMDAVWPDANVEEANLSQTIYVLRTFLKERPCGVTIENVPKRGYRLRVESPMVIPGANRVRISGIWRAYVAIAALVFIALGAGLTSFVKPPESRALDAAATGRYLLAKEYQLNGSLENLKRSDALFGSIARDYPQSALGYAGRAQTSASLSFYTTSSAERTRLQGLAIHLADVAIERDPQSAAAHAAIGGVEWSILHDDVAASASFDRALALNPHEVNALVWQGTIFMNHGHIEAARALFARAVSLAPNVPGSLASLAWSDFLLGDFGEAAAFAKHMLSAHELMPLAHLTLANAAIERGDFGTARRSILELGRSRDTHVAAAALLARVDALTGHKRSALSDLRRVEATIDPASVGDWDAASIAAAYLAVDRVPGAYVWLARVSPGQRHQIARDPRFVALRADPRFTTWVRD